MDIFWSVLPIAILIFFMAKKKNVPSFIALPAVALIMYLIHIFFYETNFILLNAAVIKGFLLAFVPISIVWGAIFLFRTMENTGAMDVVRKFLQKITTEKIAQVMIIGWAFSFFIEGASGFGTPAALAAPLLVSLGFRAFPVVVVTLVLNTIPVSFGAVGTPTWFGFENIGLPEKELLILGQKTALLHFVAALIIPFVALRFLFSFEEIKKNIIFILLSILSCTIPYFLLSLVSSEFPSLIGGAIGLFITVILVYFRVGVVGEGYSSHLQLPKFIKISVGSLFLLKKKILKGCTAGGHDPLLLRNILKAFFPLWGTILLLLITRIEFFGLKEFLNTGYIFFQKSIDGIGDFSISNSGVLSWSDILGTSQNWNHKLLYVPSVLPFVLISLVTFFLYKKNIIMEQSGRQAPTAGQY